MEKLGQLSDSKAVFVWDSLQDTVVSTCFAKGLSSIHCVATYSLFLPHLLDEFALLHVEAIFSTLG